MKHDFSFCSRFALALGLMACGGDEGALDPQLAPGLELRFCGESNGRDLMCGELEVPVDYDDPASEMLPIAMNRMLHDPNEPYRGIILFNPGGPGVSGKEVARALHEQGVFDVIAPGFDIVGFDPRGVGESGSRSCGPLPSAMEMGGEMESGSDTQQVLDFLASEGTRCEANWGRLFRELGSNNVVRDMDAMREALGQDKLNFLGISYGTRIGALYAHTFPERAGNIVLDAPVHPQISMMDDMRVEFRQTLALHEAFFAACETGELTCPPEPRRLFDEMLENATALGVDMQVLSLWREALAQPGDREFLPLLLARQATESDPSWLLNAPGGDESSVDQVVNFSVHCTDANEAPPTAAELDAFALELLAENSPFAFVGGAAAICSGWPATPDPAPAPSALEAPPLLVIGGTQDLRTPFEYAEAMTESLGNATLLTSHHYGHGATPQLGSCVARAVRNFFELSALPPFGHVCD